MSAVEIMSHAVVIIKCRKDQVLEINENVKSNFQNVDASYEAITTELYNFYFFSITHPNTPTYTPHTEECINQTKNQKLNVLVIICFGF